MQGRGEGMIKLLIVDDEMQARTGLRDMVPWESLGVTLCGEAEDAEAALPLIDEYQPDILLTDVRMHAMDGISLAWEAQQRLPDISIVFISAYMDTNYLREALHLNAADYISKPIRIQDVKKTIGKVVEDIQNRRASQEQRRRLEKLVEQSRPLLIERFLHSWLEGLFSTREELLRQAAELNLSLEQPLVPAVFQYDARSPLEPRAYNAYCLWLSGELPRYFPGALFCAHYNEGIAFLPETIWQEEERFSAALNDLRREAKASYGVELLIGLGTPRTNLLEIPQAVREARFALESSDFQHRAQPETSAAPFALYVGLEKEALCAEGTPSFQTDELEKLLLQGDGRKMAEWIRRNLSSAAETDRRKQIMLLALSLDFAARKHGLSGIDATGMCRRAVLHTSLHTLERQLTESGTEVCRQLLAARNDRMSSVARSVQRILEENYQRHLTIESLSEQVHYSPAYLSMLYHQQSGETIGEALLRIRMDEAKKLLANTNMLISEIALQTGYTDVSYFSRIFKRTAGVSPAEYRKRAQP